ncbi:APC family permease [Mycoplasma marinum]|uniref:APC family permease n=1 Tax=Mycoplasma marinum TaxID=1937190 RepID=A0A4R0XIZ0_9MOLU|nr:APC family permease [Mycoplasma marinum]TCG10563.1 APC family permease [Mycoplasma marinum]
MTNKNTMSKRKFYLFSLNYIIGFGFIATIGKIINLQALGLLAFMLTSFIALCVALAFSRATDEYPDAMGGSYYYGKKSGGKHAGFYQGWTQYIQGPVLSVTAPLFLSVILKTIDPHHSLLYDLISVGIFILITVITTFGYKISLKFIVVAAVLKWLVLITSVIAVIYLATKDGAFHSNWGSTKVSAITFTGAVLSFIYAYGGIEGVATLTGEVEVKKFRKLLLKIFFTIFTAYFSFYLIFMGVNMSTLHTNNVELFQKIFIVTMGTTGTVIYTIGIISNKMSSRASNTITASRAIIVLAQDGYLPKWIAKKNKKDEYGIAIYLNSVISIILMLLGLMLELLHVDDTFNLILDIGLFLFFSQYIGTFISLMVLSHKKEIKKIPIWEQVMYIVAIIIMVVVLSIVMIPPITNQPWLAKNTIQITSLLVFIIIGYLIWGSYSLIIKLKKERKTR